jgi:hypothetical protein
VYFELEVRCRAAVFTAQKIVQSGCALTHMGAPKSTSLGNFAFHAHLLLQKCPAVPCGGETMHIECLRSKSDLEICGFREKLTKTVFAMDPCGGIQTHSWRVLHLQRASHVSEQSCCTLWGREECVLGVSGAKQSQISVFMAQKLTKTGLLPTHVGNPKHTPGWCTPAVSISRVRTVVLHTLGARRVCIWCVRSETEQNLTF